jgi:uncharacterized protein (DUF433 family)
MSQAAAAEFIPLEADSQGVLHISGTHVTLEVLVEAYRSGYPAEEMPRLFPSLQLADVYAVLTYYLRHQAEVDAYLRRRQDKRVRPLANKQAPSVGRIQWEPSVPGEHQTRDLANERSQLLARKYGGEGLSQDENARLETLTAKLKEVLPPVSLGYLEALLEMTADVEGIRQRARERRQRLGLG